MVKNNDTSNKTLLILVVFVVILSVVTTWTMLSREPTLQRNGGIAATGDVSLNVINPDDYYRAYQQEQVKTYVPARNRITGAMIGTSERQALNQPAESESQR